MTQPETLLKISNMFDMFEADCASIYACIKIRSYSRLPTINGYNLLKLVFRAITAKHGPVSRFICVSMDISLATHLRFPNAARG